MRALSRRSLFALPLAVPAIIAAKPPPVAPAIKPFLAGRVLNITPPLIDPANLIFAVNDGPVAEISAVRDGGVPLFFDGDYPAGIWLRPPPGSYATCLADGRIMLGAPTVFALGVDAATDVEPPRSLIGFYSTREA